MKTVCSGKTKYKILLTIDDTRFGRTGSGVPVLLISSGVSDCGGGIVRLFYWLGWGLFVAAWTDWGLATLFAYDVWKELFGITVLPVYWNMTPIIIGSFGIVLIATCR